MQYMTVYKSPLGEILLRADAEGLTWLGFEEWEDSADVPATGDEMQASPILEITKQWLDIYFSGEKPDFLPPVHLSGSVFQMEVWEIIGSVPYGEVITYGEIAKRIASKRGIPRMAAQAVGGAAGRNPVSIIVPCHRVIGVNGNLVGYGGEIHRKIALLQLEHVDTSSFFIPSKGNQS